CTAYWLGVAARTTARAGAAVTGPSNRMTRANPRPRPAAHRQRPARGRAQATARRPAQATARRPARMLGRAPAPRRARAPTAVRTLRPGPRNRAPQRAPTTVPHVAGGGW